MSYQTIIAKEQRLLILQALQQDTDYRVNDIMLQAWLEEMGMDTSMDKLHTEMQWLEEQGMLTIEHIKSMQIATITQRGLDLANGKSRNQGVARIKPE